MSYVNYRDPIRGHFGPVVNEQGVLLPGTSKTRRGVMPREQRKRAKLLAEISGILGKPYDGVGHVDRDKQSTWRATKIHRGDTND